MRKVKKNVTISVISLILAMATMLSCLTIFEVQNTAKADDETTEIYYFNDFYPTLSQSQMGAFGGSYSITYDRQSLDANGFIDLVDDGYFDWLTCEYLVVIDIKTFLANAFTLKKLFSNLKNNDCKVIFVSIYDLNEYDNTDFLDYIEYFLHCSWYKLEKFAKRIVSRVYKEHQSYDTTTPSEPGGAVEDKEFDNITFLLSNDLVKFGYDYGIDLGSLYANNIFLKFFIDALMQYVNIYDQEKNIKIVFCQSIYQCTNIVTGEEIYNIEELFSTDMYAIGIWELSSWFYDMLRSIQQETDLTVFILEADPITYGPSGLEIITDSDLEDESGEGVDEEAMELFEKITELF